MRPAPRRRVRGRRPGRRAPSGGRPLAGPGRPAPAPPPLGAAPALAGGPRRPHRRAQRRRPLRPPRPAPAGRARGRLPPRRLALPLGRPGRDAPAAVLTGAGAAVVGGAGGGAPGTPRPAGPRPPPPAGLGHRVAAYALLAWLARRRPGTGRLVAWRAPWRHRDPGSGRTVTLPAGATLGRRGRPDPARPAGAASRVCVLLPDLGTAPVAAFRRPAGGPHGRPPAHRRPAARPASRSSSSGRRATGGRGRGVACWGRSPTPGASPPCRPASSPGQEVLGRPPGRGRQPRRGPRPPGSADAGARSTPPTACCSTSSGGTPSWRPATWRPCWAGPPRRCAGAATPSWRGACSACWIRRRPAAPAAGGAGLLELTREGVAFVAAQQGLTVAEAVRHNGLAGGGPDQRRGTRLEPGAVRPPPAPGAHPGGRRLLRRPRPGGPARAPPAAGRQGRRGAGGVAQRRRLRPGARAPRRLRGARAWPAGATGSSWSTTAARRTPPPTGASWPPTTPTGTAGRSPPTTPASPPSCWSRPTPTPRTASRATPVRPPPGRAPRGAPDERVALRRRPRPAPGPGGGARPHLAVAGSRPRRRWPGA